MIVDIEQVKIHFDNDTELIGELVEIFESTYPEILQSLKAALEAKSFGDVELHAHTLKGMISNFFATSTKDAAFNLEKMGRDKVLGDFSMMVGVLDTELPLIVTEARSLL